MTCDPPLVADTDFLNGVVVLAVRNWEAVVDALRMVDRLSQWAVAQYPLA